MRIKKWTKCILIVLSVLASGKTWGHSMAETPYGTAPGYTDNVDDEYESEPQEMVLMEMPAILKRPNFHDRVFNSQLSDEFRMRYQDQFGRTEQEENYFLTSRQGYYQSPTGLTATQVDDQRRAFAEFMIKRLAEYHADNLMKNDPVLKNVYAVKQALSNYDLNVGPASKFDLRYSFIGNYGTIVYTSPAFNSFTNVNMNPSSLLPGTPREVFLNLQKNISKKISGEIGYYFYDKAWRALVSKAISPRVAANVSETVRMSNAYTLDPGREGLTLAGLDITF